MTGNNHKCAFAVRKKDRESTKVAGYVAQKCAVMNQPSSAAFDPSQKILAIDIQRLLDWKPFLPFWQISQSQTINVFKS